MRRRWRWFCWNHFVLKPSEDYSESPVFDSWLPLFGFVVLFLIRRLAVMDGVPRVPWSERISQTFSSVLQKRNIFFVCVPSQRQGFFVHMLARRSQVELFIQQLQPEEFVFKSRKWIRNVWKLWTGLTLLLEPVLQYWVHTVCGKQGVCAERARHEGLRVLVDLWIIVWFKKLTQSRDSVSYWIYYISNIWLE